MINRIFLENKLPARLLLGISFLIISILGTHWAGLTHAIEHTEFNKEHFVTGAEKFMTIDEEASGIIDATNLLAKPGDKNTYFFFNAQVHTAGAAIARPDLPSKSKPRKAAIDKATIEGGAFYVMTITDWNAVFSS